VNKQYVHMTHKEVHLVKLIRTLLFLDCTPRVFWAEVVSDRQN